jgi:drug/metabolite transporter (DMT)-like permease
MLGRSGSRTDAASGSLLLNLEVIFTIGIAWLAFRENVDRRLLLGALAILAGAAILSWSGRGIEVDTGAVLIAGACLAWGIDNNLTRKLSSADPVLTAMIKGLAAGTVNAGFAMLSGAAIPSAVMVSASAMVGFVGIGISLVLFVLALRHLGTACTRAYFSLAPLLGAVLAIGLPHEAVSVNLALAGLLQPAQKARRESAQRIGSALPRVYRAPPKCGEPRYRAIRPVNAVRAA